MSWERIQCRGEWDSISKRAIMLTLVAGRYHIQRLRRPRHAPSRFFIFSMRPLHFIRLMERIDMRGYGYKIRRRYVNICARYIDRNVLTLPPLSSRLGLVLFRSYVVFPESILCHRYVKRRIYRTFVNRHCLVVMCTHPSLLCSPSISYWRVN